MDLPKKVIINEVSPRDGLQNESKFIPTDIKLKLIDLLAEAGLKNIEVGSFVSTKKIPQLSDTNILLSKLHLDSDIHYPVLVPNTEGLLRAMDAGVKEIAVFTAASEAFCQRNINCSIDESLTRIQSVSQLAQQHNIKIRAYISCVLGCPYEGKTNIDLIARLATQLRDFGAYEISLGDTIGVGTANGVEKLIARVNQSIPIENIAVHFHDTYGQALANVLASLQCGVAIIDSSVAGIGGCPYAHGAAGNLATEDLVYMLNGLGIESGVDLEKLYQAGKFICDQLQHPPYSKVALALSKRNSDERF